MATNRLEAETLNNSFSELADTLLRNRQLNQQALSQGQNKDLAQQEINLRKQQIGNQKDYQNKLLDVRKEGIESTAGIKEKQLLLQQATRLNATGALDDDARSSFNDWLNSDPTFSATGIQLSKPVNPNPSHRQSATESSVMAIQSFRDQANKATDAAEKEALNHYADLLENNLPKAVKETVSPKPERDTTIDYDKAGMKIGEKTTYQTPGKAPSASEQRVKVKGPNGQTGTVAKGTKLPDGWTIVQ